MIVEFFQQYSWNLKKHWALHIDGFAKCGENAVLSFAVSKDFSFQGCFDIYEY